MTDEPIQATITSYRDYFSMDLIDGEWKIMLDGKTLTVDEFNALWEIEIL